MRVHHIVRTTVGCTIAAALMLTAASAQQRGALAVDTAKVTIDGSSNVHAWTAATTTVRVTRVQLADGVAGPGFWDAVVKPGTLTAFEIAIPAASLKSAKDGLDKNMHKALNVQQHSDITFRLVRLEPKAPGAFAAIGMLKIAGVEKQVTLDLKVDRRESALAVKGTIELLMTDFGIAPPKAMMGMLKTDPKVKITFETVLGVPLT